MTAGDDPAGIFSSLRVDAWLDDGSCTAVLRV
jgi:hypothetical protein